jgi:hypothetical protein
MRQVKARTSPTETPTRGTLRNGVQRSTKSVQYTRVEKLQQTQFAEQLLRDNIGPPTQVERQLRERFHVGPKRARKVVNEVIARWNTVADPEEVQKRRAQAIARIRRDLHLARFRAVPGQDGAKVWVEKTDPPLQAIARLEQLLMLLEGTNQPIKVEHDMVMSGAAIGSIAKLTAQQVHEELARGEELERLATIARRQLPEFTEGEVVGDEE